MVLFRENACRQRVGRIGLEDGYDALQDDRTAIELGRHKMHRDTGDLDAVLECLSLRIHAGKRRQKRRMDVQDRDWEKPRSSARPSTRMNPARHTTSTRLF